MATMARDAPFTYLWTIENISELTYIDVKSPTFVSPTISAKSYHLHIKEHIELRCYLRREQEEDDDDDFDPYDEDWVIGFEISILKDDGSILLSEVNRYNSNLEHQFVLLLAKNDLMERRVEFVQNNALTVQCKMWRRDREVETEDFCYASTKLDMLRSSFIWEVKDFSALRSSDKENFNELVPGEKAVKPLTLSGPSMAFILYLKENPDSEDVYIGLLIMEGSGISHGYEISIIDCNGKVWAFKSYREPKVYFRQGIQFLPLISKSKLESNKNLFLPNDILLLRCSYEICSGTTSSRMEYSSSNISSINEDPYFLFLDKMLMNFKSLDIDKGLYDELFKNDSINDPDPRNSITDSCRDSCSLKTALRCLQNDESLSDISLRIGRKVSPVHKNILCSRSPVFKKILSEHRNLKTIVIEDMDENIFSDFLQYIYTDTLEDLNIEKALNLFKAAEDYQLLDLREICFDFLESNIDIDNL